jgi:hypothetical protein
MTFANCSSFYLLFYVEDYGGAGGQGAASHKTDLKSLILYIYCTYTVHTRRSSMKYSFCIFTHMQTPHTVMHEGRLENSDYI